MERKTKPTLRVGSTGPVVEQLQQKLNDVVSAGLNITGAFDSPTETAVINFQSSRGLDADGVVGSKTWAALDHAMNAAIKPARSSATSQYELEIGPGGEITVIADRRADARYVDRRLVAVGYGIYVGGFLLYLNDMDLPILVPEQYLDFGTADYKPINEEVFSSRREAEAALASSEASSAGPNYAYFEGGGGRLVAPTVFARSSAPRTIETASIVLRQLKEEVQTELAVIGLTLVEGMAMQAVVRSIVRVGEGRVAGPEETAGDYSGPEYDWSKTAMDVPKIQKLAYESMSETGPNAPVKVVPESYEPMTQVNGMITKEKYVMGRTPEQLADELGRVDFKSGVRVYRLDLNSMKPEDLQLRGYSQSPAGKAPSLSDPADLAKWPVGKGAPQWKLEVKIPATEVGSAKPSVPVSY